MGESADELKFTLLVEPKQKPREKPAGEFPDEMPKGVLMIIRAPNGRMLAIREGTSRGAISSWMRLRTWEIRTGEYSPLGDKQLTMRLEV